MSVIIYKYLTLNCAVTEPKVCETNSYKDYYSVSNYAQESVSELLKKGYMIGHNGYFNPKSYMTRAECAVLFCRLKGIKCENYIVPIKEEQKTPKEKAKEELSFLGTYRLTCYCTGCNSPKGSKQTASGIKATGGEYGTVAVSSYLYKKLGKNTIIYIDGVGYKKIQDKHGVSGNTIDVFIDTNRCKCSYNSLSNKYKKVYIVK